MVHRKFEALRELQAIRRTCFRAQIAKHAARCVESEGGQNLLLIHLLAFANLASYGTYFDTIHRTRERAKIAGYTECASGLRIQIQPGSAAKPLGYPRRLERVLLGVDSLIGISAVARFVQSSRVVPEGNHQAFEKVEQQKPSDQLADRPSCCWCCCCWHKITCLEKHPMIRLFPLAAVAPATSSPGVLAEVASEAGAVRAD